MKSHKVLQIVRYVLKIKYMYFYYKSTFNNKILYDRYILIKNVF